MCCSPLWGKRLQSPPKAGYEYPCVGKAVLQEGPVGRARADAPEAGGRHEPNTPDKEGGIRMPVRWKSSSQRPLTPGPLKTWPGLTYGRPQQHHLAAPKPSPLACRLHPPLGHPIEEEEEEATGAEPSHSDQAQLPSAKIVPINLLQRNNNDRTWSRTLRATNCVPPP